MKVEVLRTDDGVEIHRENEDGSKTVWLCDNDQVAAFKLNTLLFSVKDDPSLSKRSILIGDFDRAEEEKAIEKKPLAKRAADVADRLGKEGFVKKSQKTEKGVEVNEELLELLKQMKGVPFQSQPLGDDFFKPSVHIYPAAMPLQPSIMPQIGGFPFDNTGAPFNQPYGTIDVNVCGAGIYGASAKPTMPGQAMNMTLTDTAIGCTFNGSQKVHTFKTSFGGNG
jgi:hypothetical protein